MVGTAYLAPEPGAKPFVTVGANIKKGQTIIIIEAMKTMNHVPSTKDGVVKKILVTDGEAVEFDQDVAVHSTADNESMHVRLADESICIGSQKAQDSYLNIPSLISAIEITGADAVHPGYGFLSENYKFAEILEQHKVKFIGPSSELIRKMGDKIEAKKIAKSLGLPIVSGSETGIKDIGE
ncbi:MAG: hypothetical protein EBV96_04435, partial [Proteobacteria bacterium]|nr:hypothetical protein [Pseudomonadota bacterium]